MGQRGELFSSRVHTERRSYFFNVKENRRGEPFLTIVESRKTGEGQFDRQQVVVYPSDLAEFMKELMKSARYLEAQSLD